MILPRTVLAHVTAAADHNVWRAWSELVCSAGYSIRVDRELNPQTRVSTRDPSSLGEDWFNTLFDT
ncbi:hypothetical protein [Cellulosimicrobium marinum]|uniref:hypothetical protein n=1 Tax=Cellulosimicrobium marinum TaxID=1638992 RepID=UPI001E40910B|nr:hypothetical protein [Cellulosimicrobium marinum]MCB7136780.1 hypothetical protein [Cellulosimicrobium marinum]